MTFETERLILRPWSESDAEDLFYYAKNPNIGPIAGWPPHTSVENSREVIKNVLSAENTFAVCLKSDGKPIGSVGLFSPVADHKEREIEVGYWVGEPFWGKGYIPEAVRALQKYAFTTLGCRAMWCGCFDGNEKSRRVQEKCGFVFHHTQEVEVGALKAKRIEHFTYMTKEQWLERNVMIAPCGLDCSECDAYKATEDDDDEMREKVAQEWSKLNGVEIKREMINCDGCRENGRKTPFCGFICQIRKCSAEKGFSTCGSCSEMKKCEKVGAIHASAKGSAEAISLE